MNQANAPQKIELVSLSTEKKAVSLLGTSKGIPAVIDLYLIKKLFSLVVVSQSFKEMKDDMIQKIEESEDMEQYMQALEAEVDFRNMVVKVGKLDMKDAQIAIIEANKPALTEQEMDDLHQNI